MAYKYKAMSAGTLNPYRFIAQGETIVSPVPIEASWLKLYGDDGEPVIPVLPITSSVNYAGSQVQRSVVPPTPIPDAYALQIKKVQELEALQDGVPLGSVAAVDSPPAAVIAEGELTQDAPAPEAEGTGNQDVI